MYFVIAEQTQCIKSNAEVIGARDATGYLPGTTVMVSGVGIWPICFTGCSR